MQIFRWFFAVLLGVFPTKTLGFLLNLTVGKVWDISVGSNRRPRRFSLPLWAGDIVSSHSISRDIFQILPPPKKDPMITQRSTFFVFSLKIIFFQGTKKKDIVCWKSTIVCWFCFGRKGGGGKFSEQSPWRVIASLLKEVLSSICRKPYAIGGAMKGEPGMMYWCIFLVNWGAFQNPRMLKITG